MATAVAKYTPSADMVSKAQAALTGAVKQSDVLEALARKYQRNAPRGLKVKSIKRSFNKPLLVGYEVGSKKYIARVKMLSLVWKRIIGGAPRKPKSAFQRAVSALAKLPVSRFAAVLKAAKAAK